MLNTGKKIFQRVSYFFCSGVCRTAWMVVGALLIVVSEGHIVRAQVDGTISEVEQEIPQTEEPVPLVGEDAFNEGEFKFFAGKLIESKELFHRFLESHPNSHRADRALFRLGQIDQRSRSYTTALRFYNILINKSPNTHFIHDLRFHMGECNFEMDRLSQADELFREVLLSHPDPKRQWEALLYLGRIDEQRLDYDKALSKLHRIYVQSKDKGVRSQAYMLIKQIIDEKLSETLAVSLARKYRSGFPGDLLRLKLISLYRVNRDNDRYESELNEFLGLFPDHPEKAEIERQLKQVRDNPDRNLRLAVVLPLTGRLALTGQQVLQGIQLALNQADLRGEKRPELIVKDSAAGEGVEHIVRNLVSDPNVVGIIGPVLSENVKEVSSLAEQYRIPIFSPTASSSGLPEMNDYVFRNALTREQQGKYLAQFAVNRLHLRRFAVLYPLETYGLELKDAFVEEVESLGGEVVGYAAYDRAQTDFKAQILELGGIPDDKLEKMARDQLLGDGEDTGFGQQGELSRPVAEMGLLAEDGIENLKVSLELSYDAIFLPGFYDKVGLIIPQLVFYNIDQATLLGTNGWNSPQLIKIAGKYLKKGYFVDGFFINSSDPAVRKFVRGFNATFAEEPTILSAQSYDTTKIFIDILRRGARNRVEVWDRLKTIRDFPGVSGKTTITSTGDSSKSLFTLTIRNKKIVQEY